jgi:hypothetical protein
LKPIINLIKSDSTYPAPCTSSVAILANDSKGNDNPNHINHIVLAIKGKHIETIDISNAKDIITIMDNKSIKRNIGRRK